MGKSPVISDQRLREIDKDLLLARSRVTSLEVEKASLIKQAWAKKMLDQLLASKHEHWELTSAHLDFSELGDQFLNIRLLVPKTGKFGGGTYGLKHFVSRENTTTPETFEMSCKYDGYKCTASHWWAYWQFTLRGTKLPDQLSMGNVKKWVFNKMKKILPKAPLELDPG